MPASHLSFPAPRHGGVIARAARHLPLFADDHHNLPVLRERWKPSRGLKAVAMASWLVKAGFFYLMMRFCFPRVFLMPAMVIAGAAYAAACLARFGVLLDRAAGEVAITIGLWTRRVPLIQVERVEEVLRFGAEIPFNPCSGVACRDQRPGTSRVCAAMSPRSSSLASRAG
jgi:hypothetical protein